MLSCRGNASPVRSVNYLEAMNSTVRERHVRSFGASASGELQHLSCSVQSDHHRHLLGVVRFFAEWAIACLELGDAEVEVAPI